MTADTEQLEARICRLMQESMGEGGHATAQLAGIIDGLFRRGMVEEQIIGVFSDACGTDIDWCVLGDIEAWGVEWRRVQLSERGREVEARNSDDPEGRLATLHNRWSRIVEESLEQNNMEMR